MQNATYSFTGSYNRFYSWLIYLVMQYTYLYSIYLKESYILLRNNSHGNQNNLIENDID